MKLQHVMGARLSLDSGETLLLERLGKGAFHTCYVDRAKGQVYTVTIDRGDIQDYSKEILSHPTLGVDPNPHLPPVKYLGGIGERRVYTMPLYQPLRAQHRTAWAQFKRLVAAREEAWRQVQKRNHGNVRMSDWGVDVNDAVCKLMETPDAGTDLCEALWDLRNSASNYGASYCMEFSRRNLMVDGAGTLILLDVLFNLEAVEQINAARQKKERGY